MGWQVKALLALMVMGIMGLLAGFAMVLSDGHPGAHRWTQAAPGMSVLAPVHRAVPVPTTPGPATALPNLSTAPPLPAQVAVIENITPTVQTAAAAPHPDTASEVPPAPEVTPPSHHPLPGPARSAARRTAARSRDADVALLEAMFTHAGPTPASARAAPALSKRCQGLQGRPLEACRTQVCQAHPTSRICDQAR